MKKSIHLFTAVLLIFFALIAIVTSCNKDDSNLTKEEMLTAKSWKISSSKTNGIVDIIEDCEKDDFLTFTTSGNYTLNPGTNKCYTDDSIESGTWEFSSDEKYMIVDGESLTIVEMTASRFTFSLTDGDYKFEATYVSF